METATKQDAIRVAADWLQQGYSVTIIPLGDGYLVERVEL